MFDVQINTVTPSDIVISLVGELDTVAAEKFNASVETAITDAVRQVDVDFAKLEYISSAGMRTILALDKKVSAVGGKMTIKGMSEEIFQIFQITGFDQIIEIIQ